MKTITLDLKLSTFLGQASLRGTITVYTGPPMPGPIRVQVTQEDKDMLIFTLVLPKPGAFDVVTRELTTQFGTDPETVQALPGVTLEVPDLKCKDNTSLAVKLVDVDDQGLRSPVREQTFVVVDTIPPPQPGELGVVVTGEEPDEIPVPPPIPE